MRKKYSIFTGLLLLLSGFLLFSECAYRLVPGPFAPLGETEQMSEMTVSDDGTITFIRDRLEVGLRPMTDEELNRQFAGFSQSGEKSTNPYTYGDWKERGTENPPKRFTVFELKVKNYTYPKMRIDPSKITLTSQNHRKYLPMSLQAMSEYYYPFIVGYTGNAYRRFEERKDLLQKTLFSDDVLFSGQSVEGFVVFPDLHDDVRQITVSIEDIEVRYDAWGTPIETEDLTFQFRRAVQRENQQSVEVRGEGGS